MLPQQRARIRPLALQRRRDAVRVGERAFSVSRSGWRQSSPASRCSPGSPSRSTPRKTMRRAMRSLAPKSTCRPAAPSGSTSATISWWVSGGAAHAHATQCQHQHAPERRHRRGAAPRHGPDHRPARPEAAPGPRGRSARRRCPGRWRVGLLEQRREVGAAAALEARSRAGRCGPARSAATLRTRSSPTTSTSAGLQPPRDGLDLAREALHQRVVDRARHVDHHRQPRHAPASRSMPGSQGMRRSRAGAALVGEVGARRPRPRQPRPRRQRRAPAACAAPAPRACACAAGRPAACAACEYAPSPAWRAQQPLAPFARAPVGLLSSGAWSQRTAAGPQVGARVAAHAPTGASRPACARRAAPSPAARRRRAPPAARAGSRSSIARYSRSTSHSSSAASTGCSDSSAPAQQRLQPHRARRQLAASSGAPARC